MAYGVDAKFVGNEPPQRVVAGFAIGGLRDGPHEIACAALDELVRQHGDFEISHVVRGGDQATAGNFVTGVEDAGVMDGAGFVFVIPASAMRGDSEEVVDL